MARYFDPCLMMLTLTIVSFWKTNVTAIKKCDPYLDCFETDHRCNIMPPESPNQVNTEFFLFTPENKSEAEIIDYKNDTSITNSKFRADRKTKFIIHGFIRSYRQANLQRLKDALLSLGTLNVIMVNWEDGANSIFQRGIIDNVFDKISTYTPGYKKARQNTILVGRQIGELSRKLKQLTGASFDDMHLIGHSLGAQTAGVAGRYLSGQYGRITGLDPAGPGYEKIRDLPNCLLERTDAKFVDIIHTSQALGNQYAVGHQDFYPNGGLIQVGCPPSLRGLLCNHGRGVDYFAESITSNCSWRAYPCSDWNLFEDGLCKDCGEDGCPRMGYYADLSPATGMFMLGTNGEEPFCKDDSGQPSPSLLNVV